MIIELSNPRAAGPGDPEGLIVVAQNNIITTREVVAGQVRPMGETVPEGNFEDALADHLRFLAAAGFEVVG